MGFKCPNCQSEMKWGGTIQQERLPDMSRYGCINDKCMAILDVPIYALGPLVTSNFQLQYKPGER